MRGENDNWEPLKLVFQFFLQFAPGRIRYRFASRFVRDRRALELPKCPRNRLGSADFAEAVKKGGRKPRDRLIQIEGGPGDGATSGGRIC